MNTCTNIQFKKSKKCIQNCENQKKNGQKYIPVSLFVDSVLIIACKRMLSSNSLVLDKMRSICTKYALECFEIVMKFAFPAIDQIISFSWLNRKSTSLIEMIHVVGMEYDQREEFWPN